MRRLLRGVRRAGSIGASAVRVGSARLAFPGVTITVVRDVAGIAAVAVRRTETSRGRS